MAARGRVGVIAALLGLLVVAPLWAAGTRATYEDPMGRFRFAFRGAWRAGAEQEVPSAANHFFLVKRDEVAAELIVSSRPFPATQRFKDFVDAEVEALDAEPNMHRSSVSRDLKISGQSAARIVARLVEQGAAGGPRETLVVQYWFARKGELWSLLVLTTPAEEERSHVVDEIEKTVVASFEVLEPDEVAQALAESKKTARLANGLAEITVPEQWTLLKVDDDQAAAQFDKGRVYLFAVAEQEYGETLKEVAHGFLEDQAGLDDWNIQLERDIDVRGTPGYVVIFDGTKDGRSYVAQLVVLVKDQDAFFLYGIAEADAWLAARPWITAVQYTVKLLEREPTSSDGADDGAEADGDDGDASGDDGGTPDEHPPGPVNPEMI
jgi:hypothetical protein